MQSHGTYTVTQDTGLSPLAQSEREALAHYWALRIHTLVYLTGCTYQQAAQAVADAMQQENRT